SMQLRKRAGTFIGFRFSVEYNHDHLVHDLLLSMIVSRLPVAPASQTRRASADLSKAVTNCRQPASAELTGHRADRHNIALPKQEAAGSRRRRMRSRHLARRRLIWRNSRPSVALATSSASCRSQALSYLSQASNDALTRLRERRGLFHHALANAVCISALRFNFIPARVGNALHAIERPIQIARREV